MYTLENTAICVGMIRSQKHTDCKLVNTWNTLLLKDGSGKICKRRKKSKTVEQVKKDKKKVSTTIHQGHQ